jgi:phosphoglycolate phosphatase-like HAD superfamily hydrolase
MTAKTNHTKENDVMKDINFEINSDNVLFFDMDGTLVDTNYANFLSYKDAIKSVIQTDEEIHYNPNERFNRATLKKLIPNLSEEDLEKIIQQKERNYKENINQTKLNTFVTDILIKYSKTNKTVLVTNCREDRAILTLEYHKLTKMFSNIFFRQISDNETHINKYKNAIDSLSLSAHTVIVFENEKAEIDDAILAGISINNIFIL